MRCFIKLLLLGFLAQSRAHADEYYIPYIGMPCFNVRLVLPSSITNYSIEMASRDVKTFSEIVRQFAATNGLHDCHNPDYGGYSGPRLCAFKGDQLQIFTMPENPDKGFTIFEIAAIQSAHISADDFKSRIAPLIKSLEVRLSDRIKLSDGRITFK